VAGQQRRPIGRGGGQVASERRARAHRRPGVVEALGSARRWRLGGVLGAYQRSGRGGGSRWAGGQRASVEGVPLRSERKWG
jgi:hypothetical protein